MTYVVVAIIAAVLIWGIATYNRFVRARNMVRAAWSDIDVQLRRRADLIPNLVEVVKGYAAHERGTLVNVVNARSPSPGATPERREAETALTAQIRGLFALAEAYPDLKASGQFLSLQQSLVEVEDQIQFARRYYNGAARDFNILVHAFPSSIVAGVLHYEPYEYFEVTMSTERDAPDIDLSP